MTVYKYYLKCKITAKKIQLQSLIINFNALNSFYTTFDF